MCLDHLDHDFVTPKPNKVVECWKAFDVRDRDGLHPEFESHPAAEGSGYPRGRWIVADRKEVAYGPDAAYLTGFHAFTTRRVADAWTTYGSVVRKVRLRGVRLRGSQLGFEGILVADQMWIPKETKKKKRRRPCAWTT